ncbi:uncharacterized protein [Prorops nasuta]|uniref:uncharacterized protein n=1 Tax=Prorops nasuta TaxID=863751 RepID=UPI0034CE3577
MLAASIRREVHLTVLSNTAMVTRGPRCLFGKPNPRETVELLQEALDTERSRFAKRWGIDPCSEDKENNFQPNYDRSDRSPRKRNSPYAKQTNIHDYWRARKICEAGKKSVLSSSGSMMEQNKVQMKSVKSTPTTSN